MIGRARKPTQHDNEQKIEPEATPSRAVEHMEAETEFDHRASIGTVQTWLRAPKCCSTIRFARGFCGASLGIFASGAIAAFFTLSWVFEPTRMIHCFAHVRGETAIITPTECYNPINVSGWAISVLLFIACIPSFAHLFATWYDCRGLSDMLHSIDGVAGDRGGKFQDPVTFLVGKERYANIGVARLLGWESEDLDKWKSQADPLQSWPLCEPGVQAIRDEVQAHGTDQDKKCLTYILEAEAGSCEEIFSNSKFRMDHHVHTGDFPRERTRELQTNGTVRVKPKPVPIRFKDFVEQGRSRNLQPKHVRYSLQGLTSNSDTILVCS